MSDTDTHNRLNRLEQGYQQTQETLNKLVEVTSEMSHAVKRLAEHQETLTRLNDAREDHSMRLAICENKLKAVEGLPDQVAQNTTVTKAGIWAAGALITVVLGVIATKII